MSEYWTHVKEKVDEAVREAGLSVSGRRVDTPAEEEPDELVTDDRPLTPDEIEQRQEVGWDDEEPYAD